MNRTQRLEALAGELRRAGRTGTTGTRLAAALHVSARTIKRDVAALQENGLAIRAQAGPGGGYVLDPSAPLPPVRFTPAQAVAVAVALAALPTGSAVDGDAHSARGKVWDALGASDRHRVATLAARVRRAPPRR
ncbi:helix-turn-helix transcriptional regulator [Cellulosimicrobium marinum]|uniref:helix-turn-helix transcriptional regulator n=1 Tax=Cellulosimicrobium marinum TaxID=1638992 RepID=UPI001E5873B0|nr:HTH domain-containing protein [Cellulosimicrobium marinum]MCB7134992.1 HTH domain-containing protein [Cellulosimicrobium marinum]